MGKVILAPSKELKAQPRDNQQDIGMRDHEIPDTLREASSVTRAGIALHRTSSFKKGYQTLVKLVCRKIKSDDEDGR